MADLDDLDCNPRCLLGWPIKTRTQIWLNWIVPTALELFVYLVLIVADCSVVALHFLDGNPHWGALTLTFVWVPVFLCFCSIITSPWQWPDYYATDIDEVDDGEGGGGGGGAGGGGGGASKPCLLFILRLTANVLLFPVFAVFRLSRRLFWSIDALFYERESYERHHVLTKAAESSVFELYHFLQAFTHAAPQIVLQLYIVLREDVFRNYETTFLQIISILFSLLQMAIIVECYQRFESQRIVGRNYPWDPLEVCQERKCRFAQCMTVDPTAGRASGGKSEAVAGLSGMGRSFSQLALDQALVEEESGRRKTMHVSESNFDVNDVKPITGRKSSMDSMMGSALVTVNIVQGEQQKRGMTNSNNSNNNNNQDIGRDEVDEDVDAINVLADESDDDDERKRSHERQRPKIVNGDDTTVKDATERDGDATGYDFDTSPTSPPPPLPMVNKILNYPLNRLSTITDMILLNTEMYIKEHVPRLPDKVVQHEFHSHHQQQQQQQQQEKSHKEKVQDNVSVTKLNLANEPSDNRITMLTSKKASDTTAMTPDDDEDVVDGSVLVMPRRRKMVVGLEDDDFFGKTIAFTGWGLFLTMRMLALSTFAYFHLLPTLYLCISHYLIMLACILFETLKYASPPVKAHRLLFYLYLAYVYVFVILEFRIKFVHIRVWYGMYAGFVFTQNLAMAVWWYAEMDFDSWWFDYMFSAILYSGVLSAGCLGVYYVFLKPKDKVLFALQ